MLLGVVDQVAHVADGSTKSETTPVRHLPTSGDRPLDAVIMDERRDGPRWLCDDDDDDDECLDCLRSYTNVCSILSGQKHHKHPIDTGVYV